jgi:hypothetical protein
MEPAEYDIALLPNKELSQKLVDISQKLSDPLPLFKLDGEKVFPHLSLYMARFAGDNLAAVQEVVLGISKSFAPLPLTAAGYHQSRGYLDVEYQRNGHLLALQPRIIESVNTLRDRSFDSQKIRITGAEGLAKTNIGQYGYKYVGDLWRPHATITRFAGDAAIDAALLPNPSVFSGTYSLLGIFELGEHGTCIRQVAAYDMISK